MGDPEAVEVSPVQDPNPDVRMRLTQEANLAVLARHQRLAQRGDLQVEVVVRKVEVGGERSAEATVRRRLQDEGSGLVLPGDLVEVEEFGNPPFRLVGEIRGR